MAAMVRAYGDFAAAEDALQEAYLAAAEQWPASGVPRDPGAWLIRVASRRLIDQVRSEGARRRREQRVSRQESTEPPQASASDDTLSLLVLCCHPALAPASRVALTLRAVNGLTTAQIAHAFLVPETTMAQRITRAKRTLRTSGARFELPGGEDLDRRVTSVLHVVHVAFTEAHAPSMGAEPVDVDLADEAMRTSRLLDSALRASGRDHAEASGLRALLLLTHARRPARIDSAGELVTLADQDRSRWLAPLIGEGIALLEEVLPRGGGGPFQLQAAIAAVHAEAECWATTDWPQILELYRMLVRLDSGPAVRLNLAVAASMVHGPQAGLRLVDALGANLSLRRHHRWHAVRAHLLESQGELEPARTAFAMAAQLTASLPEQRYLQRQIARLGPA